MLLIFPKAIFPEINGYRIRAAASARLLAARYQCKAILVVMPGEEADASRQYLESLGIPTSVIRLNRLGMLWRAFWALFFSRKPLQIAFYSDPTLRKALQKVAVDEKIFISMIRAAACLGEKASQTVYLDLIDWIGQGYVEALPQMKPSPMKFFYQLEGKRLQQYELAWARRAHKTFLVNQQQQQQLNRAIGRESAYFLPNGVSTALDPPAATASYQNWYFLGPLAYYPNLEAMQWFLEELWPYLRGSIRFRFIGKGGPRDFRKKMAEAGIEVFDFTPDLNTVLADFPVCIAPMRSGAGLQNKVLEAMQSQRLVLLSARCSSGFPGFVSGKHGLLAETPNDWLLLKQQIEMGQIDGKAMGLAAKELVSGFEWQQIGEQLYQLIDNTQ
jgi:hypothetical protein